MTSWWCKINKTGYWTEDTCTNKQTNKQANKKPQKNTRAHCTDDIVYAVYAVWKYILP